jgi:hypothetical protein
MGQTSTILPNFLSMTSLFLRNGHGSVAMTHRSTSTATAASLPCPHPPTSPQARNLLRAAPLPHTQRSRPSPPQPISPLLRCMATNLTTPLHQRRHLAMCRILDLS